MNSAINSSLHNFHQNILISLKFTLLRSSKLVLWIAESLSTPILRFAGARVCLTYNSKDKIDGSGAQLQRIFGLYSLAQRYHFDYLHTYITEVAVHALDPFQSSEEMIQYLTKLNKIFLLPESDNESFNYIYEEQNLKLTKLLYCAIKSILLKQIILLRVTLPYRVLDIHPDSYEVIKQDLLNWNNENLNNTELGCKQIAVHFRSGVGGMAVQKGEKISREIHVDYFKEVIDSITSTIHDGNFKITIFTDAPMQDIEFVPPAEQNTLWSNSPALNGETIYILGNDLSSKFDKYLGKYSIKIGGDPIEAICEMSSADYLIMGRSSLSYIAGILNIQGKVYYPANFWHPPLSRWIKVNINDL